MSLSKIDKSALARAALVGLAAGLASGAAVLTHRALTDAIDCEELSGAECELLRQAAGELARWQLLFAAGLLCAAGAIFLWLRSRRRA